MDLALECEVLQKECYINTLTFTFTFRLSGSKNFVGKTEEFIFNASVDLKPVERFENGSDICEFKRLIQQQCAI